MKPVILAISVAVEPNHRVHMGGIEIWPVCCGNTPQVRFIKECIRFCKYRAHNAPNGHPYEKRFFRYRWGVML